MWMRTRHIFGIYVHIPDSIIDLAVYLHVYIPTTSCNMHIICMAVHLHVHIPDSRAATRGRDLHSQTVSANTPTLVAEQ